MYKYLAFAPDYLDIKLGVVPRVTTGSLLSLLVVPVYTDDRARTTFSYHDRQLKGTNSSYSYVFVMTSALHKICMLSLFDLCCVDVS